MNIIYADPIDLNNARSNMDMAEEHETGLLIRVDIEVNGVYQFMYGVVPSPTEINVGDDVKIRACGDPALIPKGDV